MLGILALLLAIQSSPTIQSQALMRLVKPSDYPRAALMNGEQGTVAFQLYVGADGVPKSCRIVQSSGSKTLDDRTCKIMSERARFRPRRDAKGNAVEGTFDSFLAWRIGE